MAICMIEIKQNLASNLIFLGEDKEKQKKIVKEPLQTNVIGEKIVVEILDIREMTSKFLQC